MTNKIAIDLDEITSNLDQLKDAKARCEFELKDIKAQIEKYELQLIALLQQQGVNEMQYGIYSFGIKTKQRTALDQKYLKEHFADVAQQCTFTKESESFEFKINK